MDSFQSIYSAVRRITKPVILRKLEMVFYFIFIALCFTGFILPFALEVNKVAFYTVGILSLIYAIGLYFLRLKINVTFGLMFHTAAFLLFSSFIIFDFGLLEIGGVFVLLAIISLSIMVTLYGLGYRVFVDGVNEPPVNPAWPEIDNQVNDDEQVEDQISLNHWHFNGDANPPGMPNDDNQENDVADPQIQINDNINHEE